MRFPVKFMIFLEEFSAEPLQTAASAFPKKFFSLPTKIRYKTCLFDLTLCNARSAF